ncbi:ABC transporter permease [Spirosoma validum]|uniref:ABC transporter permease n=1 Tax=Spirosoma validum TaxID=2771355 RepID=A0A927AXI3_9BACT|nr:ABC transporter permease [Spirosoma validum]MBD2751604.1 ABC transporter permease [Spirosoma validum]
MFRNYVKISLRNLWRNRKVSAISIIGLSIGLACGLVLFLLVSYMFSFDRYHAKADRTYWIVTDIRQDNVIPTDATPRPFGDVLRQNYPFIESAVRLENMFGRIISVPDGKGGYAQKFEESRNLCFTEPQFFDVFDTKWISGNPKTALLAPNTVVLSERYAQKYFGSANPIGKTLRFDNKTDLTVTGLVNDLPSNTKLRYDVFISYATVPVLLSDQGQQAMQNWESVSTMCFVTLRQGTSVEQLASVFPGIRQKYLNTQEAKKLDFHALPLDDLNHNPQYGGQAPRPILYALIAVGLFLVMAACINFINLATAYALKRSKEVGVRKVVGSSRGQLIRQFMTETALITFVAVVLSLLLAQIALPFLNQALSMLHADLSILDVFKPDALLWFGGLVAGVILLAGFYPSLVMARFNPVAALRAGYGQLTAKQVGNVSVRRGLVVVQFFITQLFIIGVIVMMTQVRHMQQTNMGFRKEAILMIPVPTGNALKQDVVRNQLRQIAGVEHVSLCVEPPASHRRIPVPFTYDTHTETEKFPTTVKVGDKDYIPLFGIKLVAGRNFLNNDTTNSEALVNVTMVKQLGLRAPTDVLGKQLKIWGGTKTIVGVVTDFHISELREAIPPTTILNYYPEKHMAALKLTPANLTTTVKAVETSWNELFPEHVFKADFVDDLMNQFYLTERILLGLAEVFSLIAILIGCLGLYGLVAFIAETRTKEIGVRKILGASPNELMWLFGREFSRLLIIGFLLASPVGWFLMNSWLRGYVYRIELGGWIFATTLLTTVLITTLTVGYESMKAALMNPAKALKTE